jgi:hypothetical protein
MNTILDHVISTTQAKANGPDQWLGHCPAHKSQRNRDLSIALRDRKILLNCFASCSLDTILPTIGLELKDLFLDCLNADPQKRKAAAQQRAAARRKREYEARKLGRLLDACREAEQFIQSRQGVEISTCPDDQLDRELSLLAEAYKTLEADPYGTR